MQLLDTKAATTCLSQAVSVHQVMHAGFLCPNGLADRLQHWVGSEQLDCHCLYELFVPSVGLLLLADRCWRAVLVGAEEPWPWRYIVTVKASTLRSGVFACTRRRPQPPHACGRYQQYSLHVTPDSSALVPVK